MPLTPYPLDPKHLPTRCRWCGAPNLKDLNDIRETIARESLPIHGTPDVLCTANRGHCDWISAKPTAQVFVIIGDGPLSMADEAVWIVRDVRQDPGFGKLGTCGGFVKRGASHRDTAHEEAGEEAGVCFKKLWWLCELYNSDHNCLNSFFWTKVTEKRSGWHNPWSPNSEVKKRMRLRLNAEIADHIAFVDTARAFALLIARAQHNDARRR